jgi:hypothetical protein
MLLAHWYALSIAGCTEIVSRDDLPQGRRRALARGEALPDCAEGAARLADHRVLYSARRGTER